MPPPEALTGFAPDAQTGRLPVVAPQRKHLRLTEQDLRQPIEIEVLETGRVYLLMFTKGGGLILTRG